MSTINQSRRWFGMWVSVISAAALLAPSLVLAALSKNSPTNEEIWRINCGATTWDYTDVRGNWWVRDESYVSIYRWGYTNGTAASTTNNITGTDMVPVFQASRWGGTNMSYKVEVPNGSYEVKLLFAETYWNASNKRKFNVAIEGVTVLTNHDIYAEVGKNAADFHTFYTTVNDRILDITFPSIAADNATICGIELRATNVTTDNFLDFIQRKMFWYFWNEGNANTGLVKWGENNFAPGFGTVSSIAGTGMGLSAITAAASRGWITNQQARDRIMNTLNTFETTMPNVHGFWYHFVNINTGARDGTTEVSTVDSALFILGALQAGEYFRTTYPEIAAKADLLYRRMDWGWWLNVNDGNTWNNQFINMGWKPEYQPGSPHGYVIASGRPEGGYFVNDWWNRYSETLFIDIAAYGSPTYPLTNDAWKNMGRLKVNSFGQNFIQEPPLFTSQFQHLWMNFKGWRDGEGDLWNGTYDTSMDYWENARRATIVNRETCINDAQGRYETNRWGLTGSDGPSAYQAYGSEPGGFHDGTVAPYAPGCSLEFLPTESLAAVRYMFFQYKHHIWGRHGFSDSFNVTSDWKSQFANALDNGAFIIAIENYRSGMVRNTAMKNPFIWKGLSKAFKPTIEITQHDTQLHRNNWQLVKAQALNVAINLQNFEDYNGTSGSYYWDAWDSQPSFDTSVKHSGARSLKTNGHTVGVNPQGGTMNMTGYTHVGVWVYDTGGPNTVELRLRDTSGASRAVWSAATTQVNQWKLITWPLSAFTAVNKGAIQNIEIYEQYKRTYYYDDIVFTKESDITVELKDGGGAVKSANTMDGTFFENGTYDTWVYTPTSLVVGYSYFYYTYDYPIGTPNNWENKYDDDTTADEPWIPVVD